MICVFWCLLGLRYVLCRAVLFGTDDWYSAVFFFFDFVCFVWLQVCFLSPLSLDSLYLFGCCVSSDFCSHYFCLLFQCNIVSHRSTASAGTGFASASVFRDVLPAG